MKKGLLVLSLVLISVYARAEFKMGYVDLQKAIQTTASGKKAKTELEGEIEKKKKELQKKEADLKKMQEDLDKKKSVLSDEVFMKKQNEFREEMMKAQELYGKSQQEIQKRERELTEPILKKMKTVVEKIAKDKGYSMIIESSPMLLYADKGTDLTDAVVTAFEKEK